MWVGLLGLTTPQSRFLLTVTVAGYVDGSAAINYIAQGGWGQKDKKPISFEKYKHTQRCISKAFISALALAYRRESVEEELKMLLQNDLGCEIVPFDWSSEEAQAERNKLSFVEATAHEVKVLQDNNLSVRIDLKKLTANWVGTEVRQSCGRSLDPREPKYCHDICTAVQCAEVVGE